MSAWFLVFFLLVFRAIAWPRGLLLEEDGRGRGNTPRIAKMRQDPFERTPQTEWGVGSPDGMIDAPPRMAPW